MTFADSPKIEYAADGRPPETGRTRRVAVRLLIAALVVVAVGINVYLWAESRAVPRLTGTDGLITGQVLDRNGEPLANAEVFLEAASSVIVRTDVLGQFVLAGVPSGNQVLIVGYNGRGETFPLTVASDGSTELGAVVFVTPISDSF